jgi:hypothetical protein
MDMIGYDVNNDGKANLHVRPIANSIGLGEKFLTYNQEYGIGLSPDTINPGTPLSDHSAFWNQNVSAVLFIEEDILEENPNYHSPKDVIDSLNLPYLPNMCRLALAVLCEEASRVSEGIATLSGSLPVHAYPSPAEGKVELCFPHSFHGTARLILRSATGAVFPAEYVVRGNNTLELDLAAYPAGLYHVWVEVNGQSYTTRIVRK